MNVLKLLSKKEEGFLLGKLCHKSLNGGFLGKGLIKLPVEGLCSVVREIAVVVYLF